MCGRWLRSAVEHYPPFTCEITCVTCTCIKRHSATLCFFKQGWVSAPQKGVGAVRRTYPAIKRHEFGPSRHIERQHKPKATPSQHRPGEDPRSCGPRGGQRSAVQAPLALQSTLSAPRLNISKTLPSTKLRELLKRECSHSCGGRSRARLV